MDSQIDYPAPSSQSGTDADARPAAQAPSKADSLGAWAEPAGKSSPLVVKNVDKFVDQVGFQINIGQVTIETVRNSIQAGATEIHVCPDWVGVEERGVYRFSVWDNGSGMSRQELSTYIRSLLVSGEGRDTSVRGNFGHGGRTAGLAVSPLGVIFISVKDGEWGMIRIWKDPEVGYSVFAEEGPDGEKADVVDVPPAYKELAAKLGIEDHGTGVILLGTRPDQDTFMELTNPSTGEDVQLGSRYHVVTLTQRFQDLSLSAPNCTVKVQEINNPNNRSLWPTSFETRLVRDGTLVPGKQVTIGQTRVVKGFFEYLKGISTAYEVVEVQALVDNSVWSARVHSFVLCPEGEAPEDQGVEDKKKKRSSTSRNPWAMMGQKPQASFGYLYNHELFSVTRGHQYFQSWGLLVRGTNLHNRVALFVEPLEDCEPHNDLSRSVLKLREGKSAPLVDWASAWAKNMPPAMAALRKELVEDQLKSLDLNNIEALRDELMPIYKDLLEAIRTVGPGTRRGGRLTKDKDHLNPEDLGRDRGTGQQMPDIMKFWPTFRWTTAGDADYAGSYNIDLNELVINEDFFLFKDHYLERMNNIFGSSVEYKEIDRIVRYRYQHAMGVPIFTANVVFKKRKEVSTEEYRGMVSDNVLRNNVSNLVFMEQLLRGDLKKALSRL